MSYMADLEYRLTKFDDGGYQYRNSEHAYLCERCGAIVVLTVAHDAHHRTLDAATAGDVR